MPLPSHTVAHILAAKEFWPRTKRGAEHLVRICRQVTASDGCECRCTISDSGCSALSIFTRHYVEYLVQTSLILSHGGLLISRKIVKKLAYDLAPHEAVAALVAKPLIRQLAFTLLGFRHTCCFALLSQNVFEESYSPDDFEEIRIEDAQSLEILEPLVAELETRFEQLDLPVHTFLENEGLKRIQEVARDLHGVALTEDERNGIEEAGVRLTMPDAVTQASENTNLSIRYSPALWLKELDEDDDQN